ncbi:hypothetical protein GYMLUDRAFT_252253 [Collybiopsis luxurians FD-317 M1]|uniref:Uncharacterized protein n=1 Tax=Collybiopsis luxurians FD-317 M1 TaxID=944289 RepID=A0A0D0BNU3_9AGAR|nr:hypothetical protein GYMLUDRAFT_252253 [Collybiopsis luxurians FD-317 M1]
MFALYPSCKYCTLHSLHSSCSLHPNSLSCTTCKTNYPTSKKFCSFKSIFCLLQFHILAKLPLIITYCFVLSHGLFIIWDKEWVALSTGLQDLPYYCDHPEELGLALDKPKAQESKRKAVISLKAFWKSQSHWEKVFHLEELDANVEMEAPEELDVMNLDYPKEVPPPPVPIPTPPAPVSGLKMWFFEPLLKQIPSNSSFPTWDKSALVSGPGKMMLEQDLWALAGDILQGAFNDLKEQLNHSSSQTPTPFSKASLIQFFELLSIINMSSANIIDFQQDELLQAYREYQGQKPPIEGAGGFTGQPVEGKEQGTYSSEILCEAFQGQHSVIGDSAIERDIGGTREQG